MPERDDPPADQHRPVRAQELVGEPPAGQRREVNAEGVELVEAVRIDLLPAEPRIVVGRAVRERRFRARDQIEHEQRPHAVVAEPLPHLGDEQNPQPRRVTPLDVPDRIIGQTRHRGLGKRGIRGLESILILFIAHACLTYSGSLASWDSIVGSPLARERTAPPDAKSPASHHASLRTIRSASARYPSANRA